MIQHPCPKKGIVFTQRAEGQLLYCCVPRTPWNTMLRRCIFLFEVFGSTSNRSSTLYLRGAGGETSLRTAIPFFGQQCQINTQADYNEQVCLLLLSGDRANTYWPLNAPTKLRYMHTSRAWMFVRYFAVPQMYIILAWHRTIDSLCALARDALQDADLHVFLWKTEEKTQKT